MLNGEKEGELCAPRLRELCSMVKRRVSSVTRGCESYVRMRGIAGRRRGCEGWCACAVERTLSARTRARAPSHSRGLSENIHMEEGDWAEGKGKVHQPPNAECVKWAWQPGCRPPGAGRSGQDALEAHDFSHVHTYPIPSPILPPWGPANLGGRQP